MPETTRYCPHCDRQFSFGADHPQCPECGETLVRWHDSPTVELSAGSAEQLVQRAQRRDDIEQLVGTQLAHYQIERFLGQGGMAHVYLATGVELGEVDRESTEIMELRSVSAAEALRMARAGEISDGPSALAILLCERHLEAIL